jgi:PKD repeat protein
MKRLWIVLTLVSLLTITAAACSKGASNQGSGNEVSPPRTTYPITTSSPGKVLPPVTYTSAPADSSGNYGVSLPTTLPEDRMIVRNGNISIVVDDINTAMADIAALADAYKGYVVSSNTWKDGERIYGAITIRVPSESYDIATKSVGDMAVEVTSQSSTTQDVTAEYVDLSAQLKNLRATETQLLAIMAKADKVADILAVQAQLTQVQSQIEQIQGRMQYLEKTSATSLINVSLSQAKLEAKISASTVNTRSGVDIQFYSDIAGGFTPYSYEWDFGDGKTSNDASPVHAYAKPGDFTITLKVTDDRGNTVTESRQNYIKVTQGGWSAAGVASGTWNAILWIGRGLATLGIVLGILSPLWIVIIVVIWLLRRRNKAKAS